MKNLKQKQRKKTTWLWRNKQQHVWMTWQETILKKQRGHRGEGGGRKGGNDEEAEEKYLDQRNRKRRRWHGQEKREAEEERGGETCYVITSDPWLLYYDLCHHYSIILVWGHVCVCVFSGWTIKLLYSIHFDVNYTPVVPWLHLTDGLIWTSSLPTSIPHTQTTPIFKLSLTPLQFRDCILDDCDGIGLTKIYPQTDGYIKTSENISAVAPDTKGVASTTFAMMTHTHADLLTLEGTRAVSR